MLCITSTNDEMLPYQPVSVHGWESARVTLASLGLADIFAPAYSNVATLPIHRGLLLVVKLYSDACRYFVLCSIRGYCRPLQTC